MFWLVEPKNAKDNVSCAGYVCPCAGYCPSYGCNTYPICLLYF